MGCWQSYQLVRFLQVARRTVGEVVAAPGQTGKFSGAHPTLSFTGPDGRDIRYRQDGMGARPVGTRVPLLFDPADPIHTVVVQDFWTLWFPAIGPLVLGLAFVLLPLFGVEIGLRGARP